MNNVLFTNLTFFLIFFLFSFSFVFASGTNHEVILDYEKSGDTIVINIKGSGPSLFGDKTIYDAGDYIGFYLFFNENDLDLITYTTIGGRKLRLSDFNSNTASIDGYVYDINIESEKYEQGINRLIYNSVLDNDGEINYCMDDYINNSNSVLSDYDLENYSCFLIIYARGLDGDVLAPKKSFPGIGNISEGGDFFGTSEIELGSLEFNINGDLNENIVSGVSVSGYDNFVNKENIIIFKTEETENNSNRRSNRSRSSGGYMTISDDDEVESSELVVIENMDEQMFYEINDTAGVKDKDEIVINNMEIEITPKTEYEEEETTLEEFTVANIQNKSLWERIIDFFKNLFGF